MLKGEPIIKPKNRNKQSGGHLEDTHKYENQMTYLLTKVEKIEFASYLLYSETALFVVNSNKMKFDSLKICVMKF